MRFLQIDVFAEAPYEGNPLAVFPDAASISGAQMQAIAREMNLSESTFVTRADADGYDVRIFAPTRELPFAGHPTIGTTWALRHLGILRGEVAVQRSPAGETPVELRGETLWLEREESEISGSYELDPRSIGLEVPDIGCDLEGRRLEPALTSAGVAHLMVPLADLDALARSRPAWDVPHGIYCFTTSEEGHLRARGFFPAAGIPEDPATGSAAAGLGLYLAARTGAGRRTIHQGVEFGRPSVLELEYEPGRVRVGGRCVLVAEGELVTLP